MVLHAVVFSIILGTEAGVIVKRLAVDSLAAAPSLAYCLDALQCADVDEIYWTVFLFSQPYYPSERNVLREFGVNLVHLPPFDVALILRVVVVVMDHVVVLRMDQKHPSGLGDLLHD